MPWSSPIPTIEARASVQLGEAQTDDVPGLHDPSQVVTRLIARRPERAEAALVIDMPAAARFAAVLDVGGSTVRFKHLGGAVVVHEVPRGECQGDQLGSHRIVVCGMNLLQRFD